MTGASCFKYPNNRVCRVEYCTNRGNNCNLSFFLLSRDDTVKYEKWTRHVKLKPNAYALKKIYVCSDHFELKCFTSTLRRHLTRSAYPTLQRKNPGEIPNFKQIEESHFVWNNMPNSENSRNSLSNSEDMCVVASLYLPSDDSKSNEEVSNLSENDTQQRTFEELLAIYNRYPILHDKRFLENREKFLKEVIDDYMKKRYVSENEEENRKLFQEKIDRLKDPVTLRNEWIEMKLAKRYGTENQTSNTEEGAFAKQSAIINDSSEKILSKETIKNCSIQNQDPVTLRNKCITLILPEKYSMEKQSSNTKVSAFAKKCPIMSDSSEKILPEETAKTCNPENQDSALRNEWIERKLAERYGTKKQSSNSKVVAFFKQSSINDSSKKIQTEESTKICSAQNQAPPFQSAPLFQSAPVSKMITINEKVKVVLAKKATAIPSTQNQVLLGSKVQSENTTIDSDPQSDTSSTSTISSITPSKSSNQKNSMSSAINNKGKTILLAKATKTGCIQNQMLLTSTVQSKNTKTKDCVSSNHAQLTSIVQSRIPIKLINQKTLPLLMIPKCSTVNKNSKEELSEKATIISNTKNQVLLASPVHSENTTVDSDPQSDTPSISTMHSITPSKSVNQKSSIPSTINEKSKTAVLEKGTKTSSIQNQMFLTSAVQSKNAIKEFDSLNDNPSTSTAQSRVPTKPVNQKSSFSSTSPLQPKKVIMVPISEVLSKNLKFANVRSFINSTSTLQSKKVLVVDNLQNINPSATVKQCINEVETCQPKKIMKLSTNNEFSSRNLDEMCSETMTCESSTESNVSVQSNLPQSNLKDDCISQKDCDSIASDIANELKQIKDIQSRAEVLSKIQKLLEEAKYKACL